MKGLFTLSFLLLSYVVSAQNLTGQWRGTFNSAGNVVAGEGDTEYVLELEIHGDKVNGYSYSYFNYLPKRYYVICRLEGTYEASSKSVVVNEEERIKGNTPPGWADCLQTHVLTFLKQGSEEKLVGRWHGYKPNGCGIGSTELERKVLTKALPPKAAPPVAKKTPTPNKIPKQPLVSNNTPKKPVQPKPAPKTNNQKPVAKNTQPAKKTPPPVAEKPVAKAQVPEKLYSDSSKTKLPDLHSPTPPAYGKRTKNILKTLEVPVGEIVQVDFYDNGEIDGDTITVFYNNKKLLSRQRLTDKPLSIKVQIDTTVEENELVMYADNLGSIPPNTALMIATIGGKRHEVYITSNEKASGTIRFRKKE